MILNAVLGGALIGTAATFLLFVTGRLAGVSGIASGAIASRGLERWWRVAFIGGLILGAMVWQAVRGEPLRMDLQAGGWMLWVAGLLVGFGSRMGNGCTSGHGVCGIARFSRRSLIATLTFIGVAMVTVWVRRL